MSKGSPFALDPTYMRTVSEAFAAVAASAGYNVDAIPPAIVGVENTKLYDVSTFTANQRVSFLNGETWGAEDAASQSVKLGQGVPSNMLLGIIGVYLRFPQVTADRADEDETQTQLAIASRGRVILDINGQKQLEVPACAAIIGETGYRTGLGAGTEYARGGVEAGGSVFLVDRPKIAKPNEQVQLTHVFEGDLMATAALDFSCIGGVLCLVATMNGLS
jgi:hypothetical protein